MAQAFLKKKKTSSMLVSKSHHKNVAVKKGGIVLVERNTVALIITGKTSKSQAKNQQITKVRHSKSSAFFFTKDLEIISGHH